jgi:CHAT domain-containing protein
VREGWPVGYRRQTTAEEVRGLKLRECKFVTVSVRNRGLYRFGSDNEPLGLIPAFLIAGTQNVLGTPWSLEDSIGRSFMAAFYDGLSHASPSEAVRKACLTLIKDGARIRHWATFLLTGAGRKLRLVGT